MYKCSQHLQYTSDCPFTLTICLRVVGRRKLQRGPHMFFHQGAPKLALETRVSSEMIVAGRPCILTTWLKNASATSGASVFLPRGIKCIIFEKRQTTTSMVQRPNTVGKSVRKSIAMSHQGIAAIGIGWSSPLVTVWSTLVR